MNTAMKLLQIHINFVIIKLTRSVSIEHELDGKYDRNVSFFGYCLSFMRFH